MKKQLFLTAALSVALAGCVSENDFLEPVNTVAEEANVPIVFSSNRGQTTRADITGKDAADLLGNQFVVSGYKGSSSASVGSIVFDNYAVQYKENTANTTESNTRNWEYVGIDRIKHAIDNGITTQTIKYWDYTQPQYDFIAWSTGKKEAIYEGSYTDGQVLVSAITPETATGTTADPARVAYTFEGKAEDLKECYIADLVTVKKANYGSDPVTLHFRQLGTKVRIGLYETVPGYSVKDVQFYSAAASDDAQATAAKLFTTVANDIYTEGKYTVTFPTVDDETASDNNLAHVSFAPLSGVDQKTTIDWGALNYTIAEDGEKSAGKVFLGRSSNTASFAGPADDDYYVTYLPNETGTNLNLRVNYTLESTDGSGEVITVKGATAQVPLIYTQWKPGYAYTYIFKISDRTNGYTGVYDPTKPDDTTVNSDPAGLWPITFDAVVVNAEEDNTQETITTVSAPSITTYQKGSNVVNNNEYLAATGDIYVTVNDGDTDETPDLANGKLQTLTGKATLYTIPAGTTEAEVVDALSMQDDDNASGTIKGRNGVVLTNATLTLTDKVEYGADGNTIEVETDQAAKFTPAAGTYAFVYTKKAADEANNAVKYEAVSFDDATVTTKYRYDYKDAGTGDVQKGTAYFAGETSGQKTVFLGQGVANLYLDNTGTTIATGYAVTGTTYYYTTDNGMTYTAAHNVAYSSTNWLNGLYEADTTPGAYEATTDTEPADGKAYYYKDGEAYIYCVFLPEQADALKVLDTTKYVVATETTAVAGMTYFDMYTKNDGVYYTKVIKVQ